MARIKHVHSKLVGLAFTMFVAVLLASGAGGYILYQTSISEAAQRLTEIVKSNARMIEAVAQYNEVHTDKMHSGESSFDITLRQIRAAHEKFRFGHSGEFILAKKEGNQIVFLIRNYLAGMEIPESVAFDQKDLAEPMQNALSGESGWMIGHDFRGVNVMAAYEPVNIFKLGIVAKIDMQEVRLPFIKAGMTIIVLTLVISLFALRIFYRTSLNISEKFEDSSRQFIRLATNATDMIYRMSIPEGKYEYVNPTSKELFGVTPDEFYQSPLKIQELIHPEWHQYFDEQWQKLRDADMPPIYEYQIVTPSGETKWISQRNFLVRDDNGSPVAIEGIATDITEHIEHTNALMREKEIAQSYLDIVGAIMVALNKQGEITLINRKACQVLGWSEQEALGMSWFENFVPADVKQVVVEVFGQIIAGDIEPVEFFENTILTRNGDERVIEWHNSIVIEPDGLTITGLLSSGQDITERKQAERALYQSEQHFKELFSGNKSVELIIDPELGDIIEANRAAEKFYGYDRKQLLNMKIFEINTLSPEQIKIEMARAKLEKINYFLFRHRLANGNIRDVEVYSGPIHWNRKKALYSIIHDISDRKQAELALRNSEEKFRELFEQTGGYCMILDPNTSDGIPVIVDANKAACLAHGYTREEFIGRPVADIDDEEGKLMVKIRTKEILKGKPFYVENQHVRKDGSAFTVEVNANRINIGNGSPLILTTEYDITSRIKAEEQIRTLSQAIEQSPVSVLITDPDGCIEYVNSSFEKITGFSMAEVKGQNPRILKSGKTPNSQYRELWESLINGRSWEGEFQNKKKNGELFWEHAHISPVMSQSGEVEHFITVKEDITQKKEQEEKILHQAYFDSLTDLPNRFLSLDRLTQLIYEAKRDHERIAVLFIDLDDFKKINDSIGHETGDELLIEASDRLRREIRGGDTAGRLGGDEFLMLLGGIQNPVDAQQVATNLLHSFREPFRINNREFILTASIGIAIYPEDGADTSELLRNADSAMYHSKDKGRNTYSFFTEAMNHEISRKLALEEQILGALERGEFHVLYQPQVEVRSGQIIGAEALLRWTNPVLGSVSPVEFIPVAEHSGLIIKLGEYVMEMALQHTKGWHQYLDRFRIAVNLSPRQFRDPDLVSTIQRLLEQTDIDASFLELEITEGVLMSGHDYINKALSMLSNLGIHISMDDFGTGYSSLSYLRSYPFNILKIDQSFIKDISVDPADRELISAAIAMAHGLNLKVVAEGVETQDQLDYLVKLKCDYAQGYFYSKPIDAEKLTEILQTSTYFHH